MKTFIIITSLLLSLGSSGLFIWSYSSKNNDYKNLTAEEISLSDQKSDLSGNLKKDLDFIEQSPSLSSVRIQIDHHKKQLSLHEEELQNISSSSEQIKRLEEERKSLNQQIDELKKDISDLKAKKKNSPSTSNSIDDIVF